MSRLGERDDPGALRECVVAGGSRHDGGGIFCTWRSSLAALFVAGGMSQRDAASFATTLIAATEGAVVLSRAERSLEPFEVVAGALLAQATSLSSPRKR